MSDPYVYEGTNILRNIPGIKIQKRLDDYENTISNLALIKIFKEGMEIKNTLDIFTIHKLIFEDIYEWAGTPRLMDIEKYEIVLNGLSVVYESFSNIENEIVQLNKKYFSKNWTNMSRTTFVNNLTKYISYLWQIHPFREGNTRTVTTYLYFFLQKFNYNIDISLLKKHAKFFRNAMVMASLGEYSEYNYLETILEDAIENKSGKYKIKSKNNYTEIKDIKMEQYHYNYHHPK